MWWLSLIVSTDWLGNHPRNFTQGIGETDFWVWVGQRGIILGSVSSPSQLYLALILFPFSYALKYAILFHQTFSSWCFCPQDCLVMGWIPWNFEPNYNYPPLICGCQVLYYSGKKTNSTENIREVKSTLWLSLRSLRNWFVGVVWKGLEIQAKKPYRAIIRVSYMILARAQKTRMLVGMQTVKAWLRRF